MNLISINNVYINDRILWEFSFDIIESSPSIRFKIEQADDSTKFKYANISNIKILSNNKVSGLLMLGSLFEADIEDTSKIDIQNDYVIREIKISYNRGTDIIVASIETSIPLDELVNDQNQASREGQQQVHLGYVNSLGSSKKLFIYQPTLLDMPFSKAEVYIAEFNTDHSWYGFTEPILETMENVLSLLTPDEDGVFESAMEYDGAVFVIAEQIEENELKAIEPIQMKLFRTNRAIAWIEDFDLESNSPLQKEALIQSETLWSKRGLAFTPLRYKITETLAFGIFFPNIEQYKSEQHWGRINGFYIDIENQPEKIEQEYTQIIIDDFGKKESML